MRGGEGCVVSNRGVARDRPDPCGATVCGTCGFGNSVLVPTGLCGSGRFGESYYISFTVGSPLDLEAWAALLTLKHGRWQLEGPRGPCAGTGRSVSRVGGTVRCLISPVRETLAGIPQPRSGASSARPTRRRGAGAPPPHVPNSMVVVDLAREPGGAEDAAAARCVRPGLHIRSVGGAVREDAGKGGAEKGGRGKRTLNRRFWEDPLPTY